MTNCPTLIPGYPQVEGRLYDLLRDTDPGHENTRKFMTPIMRVRFRDLDWSTVESIAAALRVPIDSTSSFDDVITSITSAWVRKLAAHRKPKEDKIKIGDTVRLTSAYRTAYTDPNQRYRVTAVHAVGFTIEKVTNFVVSAAQVEKA